MAMENALDYIPYRPLIEAMYFGELHDAKWMLDLNLVNCVTTKEEFWPTVMRYAQKVVSMPSDLIQRGRQAYFDMIRIPRGPARIKCAKDALKDILVIQGRHQKGNPSLTSIDNMLFDICTMCTRNIINVLAGERVNHKMIVTCEFVERSTT